jgi:hypothetical protein
MIRHPAFGETRVGAIMIQRAEIAAVAVDVR